MAVDVLQAKIRKLKNPTMVCICPTIRELPLHIKEEARHKYGQTLRAASARWSEAEDYAHCMLPHESTDAVTEGFRRAIRTVETGDPSAAADIALLRVRIQGLADGSASRSATFFSRGR